MIIGHNISFDKRVLIVEFIRNHMSHNFIINNRRKVEYCTMLKSVNICKIPFADPTKAYSNYKYPKLSELYYHLFHQKANNLHNSMADVLICFRAYCILEHNIDVLAKNLLIKQMFEYNNIL